MRAMVRSGASHKEMMEALSPTHNSAQRKISPRKIKVNVEKPTFYTSVRKEALFADYEVQTQKVGLLELDDEERSTGGLCSPCSVVEKQRARNPSANSFYTQRHPCVHVACTSQEKPSLP
eukprot:3232181-Pyramimonas_sp.AAC.2